MADNVAITAGSGTNVAADDISSVFFQRVKLAAGPDGTHTGDAAGRAIGSTGVALWVDPRPNFVRQSQDSGGLTTASTAYSIGDTLGSGWTFTGMARDSAGAGRITGIRLLDVTDLTTSVTLYFASGSITFGSDNAAPSVSDADAAKILASHTIAMADLGGNRVGIDHSLSIEYACDATSLYVYAVTNVAHSFFAAVTDLKLWLAAELY